MSIDASCTAKPARVTRRLRVGAGALALAMTMPAGRLAAQAPSVITFPDTLRVLLGATQAAAAAPSGCLSLRVFPGDTAGRAMPRATGDSLVDPRMPRGGDFRPPCEPGRPAAPVVTRLFRMPDGTYRPVPTPRPSVPHP